MPTSDSSVQMRGIKSLHTQARTLAAIVAVASVLPAQTLATQYSLEYELDTRYEYNSNVGLRANNEVDVHGVQIKLPAKLSLSDERYTAYADGELATSKYDDSGYNSDDQKLNLGGEYKLETGSISGNAGIDRNSTTQTAFLDNGVVGATADRVVRYQAGLNGLLYISEKNALISGIAYSENDYDTPRLVDNENLGGYVGVSHQYSETTLLQLRTSVSRFENDSRIGVESDTIGVQAGFTTSFSERFSASVLGGYSDVETEYSAPSGLTAPDDNETSGWILNSALKYVGDRYSLEGSAFRRETASADGYLIVSNQLNLDYDYQLTERFQLSLQLIAGNSGALDDRIENDRDYASGRIFGRYRLTENWYLSGSYTYRYQDRERDPGDADLNLVIMSIVFQPNALNWSR